MTHGRVSMLAALGFIVQVQAEHPAYVHDIMPSALA